ncbi:MAG TPA: PAS domain-containing protein [Usitatibacteraceae bacterium]|nr:PAS domain-containing protein [Usitatibacteraceae bacterium]
MPSLSIIPPDALATVLAELRPGLDLLGLPCCVVDTELRYRYVNPGYPPYFGRTAGEMLGFTVSSAFSREPTDDRRKVLARALAGESLTFDRETLEGPNEGRWVRAHYVPVRSGGAVVGVAIALVDIQHLKEAQSAIAARERQLSLITDTIGFPVTYIDSGGIVRFANAQSAAWAGLRPADMVGRPMAQLAPPEIMSQSLPLLQRAWAGESVTYEREALWTGREKRRIRGHMIPDKDESGAVRGAIIVLMDIEEDHRLQESLLARTRELQLITENVGVPMAYIGTDRRFRFANTPGLDWVPGVDTDNIIGMSLEEVYPPEVLAVVLEPLGKAMAGEKVAYERQGTAPDGTRRWARVNLIPDLVAGEVHGVFVVVIDIDADRRLRDALERQERQLRFYAENIPEIVAFVDAGFRYQFVNKTFERLRGLAAADIIGRPVPEVLGEEAAAKYFTPFVERLKGGETCTYERLLGRGDGNKRWFRMRLEPYMGDDGAFRGYYIVGTDVHDVKLAQDRLADQEAKLRLYTDNIPVSVAYLDTQRRYVFVNRTFADTRGMKLEDIIGRTSAEVLGEEAAAALTPMVSRVLSGQTATYERKMILPSGERRWILGRSVPDHGPDGKVRGMFVVGHDVQELKDAQEQLRGREEELRFFAENIPEAIVYVDLERGCTFVNNVFLESRGLTREFALGKFPKDVYPPDLVQALQPYLDRVVTGETVTYERRMRVAGDGEERWVRVKLSPRKDAAGRVLGYYVVSNDVHEQKMVEEALRRTNSILSAHFENTPLAVMEWDPSLRVIRWSGAAQAIFGWSADEVLGRSAEGWRLIYEDDAPAVGDMIRRLAEGPGSQATMLNRNYRKDGSVIWVEWHNSAMRDASGHLVSILSLAQDVSSRIQAEERLQFMATHDGLTGLPNRLLLPDRLASAITRAQRFGHGVAVLFLDLDHFKDVNDTLGHRVGDELLKDLSRRIRGSLRQTDLLVRLSGDEFVVVLEDLEGESGPDRVAQKILDDVMRPFPIEGHEVQVSASLGYAVFPDDGGDPETLLKNADAAMYHAKELGRNSYRAFSRSLAQRRDQRFGLETALKRAIRGEEFELFYQPILDVATGNVSRAEALVRWNDPARGVVLPLTFIPVAEEAGLMRGLGHWVFETAARQAAAWNGAGIGPFTVSVNLSASQLRDSTIVAELEAMLLKTGCSPTWLMLEITETSMVKDVEGVSLTLRKLRRMGLRIAIDDFGTGYSSLSHLRHMPVDTLKIDKSFVADIDDGTRRAAESGGAAIVAAVIGLARGLGLEVVAEGVERQAQLAFLREQGCGAYQGYLACPPLPAAEFARWLAGQPRK